MARKKPVSRKRSAPKKTSKKTSRRSCGCVQSHFGLLDRFPQGRQNRTMIEAHTDMCMKMGEAAFRVGVTTVPVVVHVVHRTASENISDAQVKSQIKVLNRDFRAKNTDKSKVPAPFKSLVGDAKIEFELAKKDPDGNTTTGITRTKTTKPFFTINDDVKSTLTGGIEPWDTKKYLNIWVCTLFGSGGTLLGYAQFPGFPPETDGVVILNTAFGDTGTAQAPFNKGRTATHEVGHYFNLSHIFGESLFATCGDTDFVADTPNQFDSNDGTPSFPRITCGNGPNGDMFMNYMDYVDDAAMFMFSKDQVARMQAALTGPRSELGT